MGSPPKTGRVIQFGEFELDTAAGELRRQGSKLRLQDQPLQILQILLQRPGEIVAREELQLKVWPSDTFVDFDHGINNAIKRLREALGDTADTPRFVETLPRRGYRFIGKIEQETPKFRSLAVLPLDNLSRDSEQEYLADGLTEALITTLAKIGELRVVSRTSSMLYKGVRKPLREIARELDVDAIVEGTVLRAGDRVRITAQLIDPVKENHLWAESYDRHLRDILDLQADVARAIAHEVEVKLTPQEQAQLAQVHPVDPEAYEAYLRGRFHWIKRTREGHIQACQHFQQAIAKDPSCAPAYAGLADALSIMNLWGLIPPEEGCAKARGLALKALEIDHSLSEAHTSFAWAALHYDYDFATAEKEFERAIELNPRNATAHHWFGMSLGMMGRYEEGYTELKRAIRLDPHWSYLHFGLAFVHWSGRRYDEAIESCKRALELDPNSAQVLGWLGMSCVATMAFDPAIAALEKSAEISLRAPAPLALLGEAYAAAGASDQAQQVLEELIRQRHVPKYFVSRVYAALGQTDAAVAMLEAGYRERGEWMVLMKVDSRFDPLRSDPRFEHLMQRMNFPRAN
jgi:TolB-like protein/Tfp pilus assembly protein PilF